MHTYGYNANGDQTTRTLSGVSYALTYDFDDQLVSTGGSGFAYDAAGRRVSRTAGGVTTSFLYNGGSVLLEKQGSSTTATYTYGNALIRKDGETPLFDGLGSERTVTSSTGSVTASLTLSAFGQTIASSGSSTSAYQFGATSGYRTEGDAGLTLVGCRFYDAQAGRFISRDTYLDQKPYAYCDGDPVNAVDPSGHFWNEVIGGGLAGIAVGIFIATLPVSLPVAIIGGIILGGAAGAIVGAGAGWLDQQSGDPNESPGTGAFQGGIAGAIAGGLYPLGPTIAKAMKDASESDADSGSGTDPGSTWPPPPDPKGY